MMTEHQDVALLGRADLAGQKTHRLGRNEATRRAYERGVDADDPNIADDFREVVPTRLDAVAGHGGGEGLFVEPSRPGRRGFVVTELREPAVLQRLDQPQEGFEVRFAVAPVVDVISAEQDRVGLLAHHLIDQISQDIDASMLQRGGRATVRCNMGVGDVRNERSLTRVRRALPRKVASSMCSRVRRSPHPPSPSAARTSKPSGSHLGLNTPRGEKMTPDSKRLTGQSRLPHRVVEGALTSGEARIPLFCVRKMLLMAVAVAGWTGCATAPDAAPRAPLDDQTPFLRRAQRELALLVHWRGPPPSPADQEVLARTLESRLADRYGVPVTVRTSKEPYRGIVPSTLTSLAKAGIDDAVVVEAVRMGPQGPFRGRVQVVALSTQNVLHDLEVKGPRGGRSVTDSLQRFADAAYIAVSRRWTAPGRAPAMDPLLTANNLYARRACAHAVPLYDLALEGRRPARADLIATYEQAESRRRQCQARLDLERRIAEDATASFSLRVTGTGMNPRTLAALNAYADELAAPLAERTDKPAFLHASSEALTLSLRHHPGRTGQPRLERVRVAAGIDLAPLRPVFTALLEIREAASEQLPMDLAVQLRNLPFRIRLEHLHGDALSFDLVGDTGTPILGPRLTVFERSRQLFLQARSPEMLREELFVLGPLVDGRGRPTQDARAVRFIEATARSKPEAGSSFRVDGPGRIR